MIPSINLATGQKIPVIGLGTYNSKESDLTKALDYALEIGYRHIDTATAYENEAVIGKVLSKWIQSGKIKREDLFIVTKLPSAGHSKGHVQKWIKRSLEALQLEYIDLYLIHTPFAFESGEVLNPLDENGNTKINKNSNIIMVWKEMEEQVEAGRTKAIGLSNFNENQIKRILDIAKYPISNLQIELHVYFQQNDLIRFCKNNEITVTAYAPLGTREFVELMGKSNEIPHILDDPKINELAKKYKKSPAQIALKFILQKECIIIPKSTKYEEIKQNISLFDFEFKSEDVVVLNSLDKTPAGRICDFLIFKGIDQHPEYFF